MSSLKNILAGALIAASTILPVKAADIPKPYVETSIVSDYVAPSGARIADNCRQDLFLINPTENLTLSVWQNNSRKENAVNERDYGISYSTRLTDKLSANVGFAYWSYPTGTFGHYDSIENASLNYSDKFNASLKYTHMNKDDETPAGNSLYLKVSKGFQTSVGKTKLSATPSLAVAALDNFYGNDGVSQATVGLDLGASGGKWNAHLFLNSQRGLTEEMESFPWGGASFGYQF